MVRWRKGRRSSNIDDRRGQRSPGRGGRGGVKLSGGVLILALLGALIFGKNPLELLQLLGGGAAPSAQVESSPGAQPNDEAGEFVSVILASTEDVWSRLFQQSGSRYRPPTLVLFTDVVQSACGVNSAATGPFYCPADQQVYMDLGFMRQLQQLGARGDFPMAYVVAHEVGHHIQTLTGTSQRVTQMQRQTRSQADRNALSVRLELQADCFAGVWAHYADEDYNLLEAGDIQEGLDAAAAIGDDRLQQRSGRAASRETFTHGSSRERMQWFRNGYETGDPQRCDTFSSR